ncbi:M23 family metallopeptidase [Microbacterium sp. 1P10UB]|uniref:M23 family metallopeptidase n=1 Tax=unclassified Microbacterium TaxID=2609290 RepID=UPI0039A26305
MTDQPTSPAGDHPQSAPTRRSLRHTAPLPHAGILPPPPRRRTTAGKPARHRSNALRPMRSLAVLTMVSGLVATVALPAYAAWQPADAEISTLQQIASDDAQSLVVASDSAAGQLSRESYAATTQAEIDQKKAAEAAAARARELARVASVPFDYNLVPPGSGTVRWPVGGPFTVTDRFGDRGGAHMGTDMVAAGGTPVYASVDGVVRISQDSYNAYGVTVVLESVLNGQQISTVYPHMQTGSRQVAVGETVTAGQLVGLVGSTGRSTANHLHFEVYLDGIAVDSLTWLEANAG